MKAIACLALLVLTVSTMSFCQEDPKAELPVPASLMPVNLAPSKAEQLLIHRDEPTWQGQEVNVCVSGTVALKITVGTKGRVVSARVISGPAMICQAVLDAIRQWEYKPYVVNGKPREFSTRVSVKMSTY